MPCLPGHDEVVVDISGTKQVTCQPIGPGALFLAGKSAPSPVKAASDFLKNPLLLAGLGGGALLLFLWLRK